MRWKWMLPAALCAGILISYSHQAAAQVAPQARLGGWPVYAGIGISRYNLDYGPGRYMEGATGWVGVNLFHGLGVDGSARSIFMNTPTQLTRMQQNTFMGGVHWYTPHFGLAHPYVRMGGGIASIAFPSRDPNYTRDTYSVYAPSGGVDFRVVDHVYIRGEYEYQFVKEFHGPHDLTPQGWTIGAIYSFRGRNPRPHPGN